MSIHAELNDAGEIMRWGLCIDDCPAEAPSPSCLVPPPIPAFGIFETEDDNVSGRFNYNSSWFQLNYFSDNESFYEIRVDELERLHQPHWLYDDSNTTDNIHFLVETNLDHFNAAYKIVQEGGEANYTGAEGYIFEGTHNITQRTTCRDWKWEDNFNQTRSCVRK